MKKIDFYFDFASPNAYLSHKVMQTIKEKYQVDLIGRDYCRDRSIACEKSEFDFLITWKKQKANFVMAHEKWIESILKQMKEIKIGLKGYKYLDEAIELATELGLSVT